MSVVLACSTSAIALDGGIASMTIATVRTAVVCMSSGCRNTAPTSMRGHSLIQ
jgi:hypothetical protein